MEKERKYKISIIVPVLNEEEVLTKNSSHFNELKRNGEVIFVDGGSSDRTIELASRLGKVVKSKRGRAHQLNLGAKEVKGDALLFLHADCYIKSNALLNARECIGKGAIGGCFTQRLVSDLPVYRKIENKGNRRARERKIFSGDQGIFVRKDIFFGLGGFPEVPVLEDILFSKKLRKAGRVKVLDDKIYVSPRRWQKDGVFKTNILYTVMSILFLLHVPLEIIKVIYKDIRLRPE